MCVYSLLHFPLMASSLLCFVLCFYSGIFRCCGFPECRSLVCNVTRCIIEQAAQLPLPMRCCGGEKWGHAIRKNLRVFRFFFYFQLFFMLLIGLCFFNDFSFFLLESYFSNFLFFLHSFMHFSSLLCRHALFSNTFLILQSFISLLIDLFRCTTYYFSNFSY